jgi:hypothetical protein
MADQVCSLWKFLLQPYIVSVTNVTPYTKMAQCFQLFYADKDCYKTKRIREDNKVFSLYRPMIEKEAEKINSAVLKYIIMLVVIISLAKSSALFVPA